MQQDISNSLVWPRGPLPQAMMHHDVPLSLGKVTLSPLKALQPWWGEQTCNHCRREPEQSRNLGTFQVCAWEKDIPGETIS